MKTSNSPRLSRAALAIAIVALSAIAVTIPARAQRLPQTVHPENYALTLTPDLKAATFTGAETIDVTLSQPVNSITLNAIEIAFQSVTISAGGSTQSAAVALDNDKQQATFSFPTQIPAGKATLTIGFTGILNNKLRGFYLSKTARRNYAVTQFEATDARRAFPCFDEPAFKATYDVSLVVDGADTAISNSSIAKDTSGPGDGKHTLQFATTPKMSTYLVAILVGDFQCSSGEQDGVAIRVCSTPDKVGLTPYGVDIAKYVLHYYSDYFGIPYPLKKLDLIGLPDFEVGAMENFGAITYRETDLLIDEKTASEDSKRNVALVIAHEVSHQWFGDLVTMRWWDNLWLNEGFANWLESKPIEKMHPEWNVDQTAISGLDIALNLDSQPTTRAIRARADTPEEIDQMFDGISYDKASDVLLMVENYLGEETFRKGVHAYLSAHLSANATAEDFWNALTLSSHKPVDKIMESLVAQPGVPLLTFASPSARKVSVAQRRFFVSPSIKSDPSQVWTLPICFKTSIDGQQCEVLSPGDSKLKAPADALFFANARGKGYYRSAYPADVYSKLVAGAETALTPVERISLTGDEWAQVRANTASVGQYLDLVAALKSDPNAVVVGSALDGVKAILDRVASTAGQKAAISAWLVRTFGPEYAKLGPPSSQDTPGTRELRAQYFSALGYYGKDPAVIAQARVMTERLMVNPAEVEPTLGRTASVIAARNGDASLFDELQKVYETSFNPEYQQGALRLLVQFKDPALLERALNYAVSDKVRNQDAAILIAIALGNVDTRDVAWRFIQNNWDKVAAQLTQGSGAIVVGSAASFCSEAARDDVKGFFATHKVAASDSALKHAIEYIDGCIELRSLQEPKLREWLAAQK